MKLTIVESETPDEAAQILAFIGATVPGDNGDTAPAAITAAVVVPADEPEPDLAPVPIPTRVRANVKMHPRTNTLTPTGYATYKFLFELYDIPEGIDHSAVARKFGLKVTTANSRCCRLRKQGLVTMVSQGHYRAVVVE